MQAPLDGPFDGCKFPPGVMVPDIDPSRCEAKGPCVPACPFDVLAIRTLSPEERTSLSPIQRFRSFVHGNKRAFVTNADACRGCGLCVAVCPEKAIKLERRDPPWVSSTAPGRLDD
jgi:NAD-dependent dihydropyrimidine dehydrogenase PreA subunit